MIRRTDPEIHRTTFLPFNWQIADNQHLKHSKKIYNLFEL